MNISSFWPSCVPRKGSAAGRKFLAPPYCSQRAVFASPLSAFFITIIIIITDRVAVDCVCTPDAVPTAAHSAYNDYSTTVSSSGDVVDSAVPIPSSASTNDAATSSRPVYNSVLPSEHWSVVSLDRTRGLWPVHYSPSAPIPSSLTVYSCP